MMLDRQSGDVNRRDTLLAIGVATLWGFNFVVIDWGMRGIPPLLFVALRFAIVSLAAFIVPRPDLPWRSIVGVGLFMSLGHFGFLYASMAAGLQPGIAALLLQGQVVFTIVIAAGFLRERPTRAQAFGVGMGMVGLAVVGIGRGGDAPLTAVALCLAGALSWGVGNVIARAAGRGKPAQGLSLTVWSSLVVPIPALAGAIGMDGWSGVVAGLEAFGWRSLASTLYTALLCTLLGNAIFTTLLARNPSATVVPWVLLAPVVAMTSAWLLLDQGLSSGEFAGGLALVLGVLITMGEGSSRIPYLRRRRFGYGGSI